VLSDGTDDSARLTCDILKSVGAHAVSLETSVEAVLAHLGLTERHLAAPDTAVARHVDKTLFLDLDAARLARLLDMIAERATPFMDRADFSAKRQITALVRRLALKVLEADPGTTPHRVWTWLEMPSTRPADTRCFGPTATTTSNATTRLRPVTRLRQLSGNFVDFHLFPRPK